MGRQAGRALRHLLGLGCHHLMVVVKVGRQAGRALHHHRQMVRLHQMKIHLKERNRKTNLYQSRQTDQMSLQHLSQCEHEYTLDLILELESLPPDLVVVTTQLYAKSEVECKHSLPWTSRSRKLVQVEEMPLGIDIESNTMNSMEDTIRKERIHTWDTV